jgi:hypothetical protein
MWQYQRRGMPSKTKQKINKNTRDEVQIYNDCVIYKVNDYTGKNGSHRDREKYFKEKSGSRTKKTKIKFSTKDSYTWNITHNTESTEV